jgi:hypothetical protein
MIKNRVDFCVDMKVDCKLLELPGMTEEFGAGEKATRKPE